MDTKTRQTVQDMQAEVDSHYWHHSIDFGNGVVTKGAATLAYTTAQANALYDGVNLNGRSILDIGAWNGAFSFEAKQRGAALVLASDSYCWNHEDFKGRQTFDLARSINGLGIETRDIDVPDITRESVGHFDAVLFSGVFYHLLTPVHLTKQIATCADHLLIIETHQDFLDSDKPGMVMYPHGVLNGDGSNWWGPNPQAMYEMLWAFGFVKIFYQDSPGYDDPTKENFRKRGIYHAFRADASLAMFGGKYAKWMDLENPTVRHDVFKPLRSDLTPRIAELEKENAKLLAWRDALLHSTSWKITAPIRAIARLFKG